MGTKYGNVVDFIECRAAAEEFIDIGDQQHLFAVHIAVVDEFGFDFEIEVRANDQKIDFVHDGLPVGFVAFGTDVFDLQVELRLVAQAVEDTGAFVFVADEQNFADAGVQRTF